MGIFGKLFGNDQRDQQARVTPAPLTPADPPASPVSTTINDNSGGLLNLNKGDILDLNKYGTGLDKVRAAAGWQVNTGIGQDYDLDLTAFLMEGNSVKNVVYYGAKKGPGLWLDGDNLTGSTGENDDENIHVTLSQIPAKIDRVVFAVVIYQAKSRHQKFKNVKNAYMRLVDEANGKEICRYVLSDDGGSFTAATLAALNRSGDSWTFEAIGKYSMDSIESLSQSTIIRR